MRLSRDVLMVTARSLPSLLRHCIQASVEAGEPTTYVLTSMLYLACSHAGPSGRNVARALGFPGGLGIR